MESKYEAVESQSSKGPRFKPLCGIKNMNKRNNNGQESNSPKKQKFVKGKTVNCNGRTPYRKDLSEQRNSLPVTGCKERIIEEIGKHETLIFISDTGSGKTTQIPQFVYENGMLENSSKIAITQPRRVAAITIAQRVSEEMNTKLGDVVGYSVRFDDMTSNITQLKYMTDGMLLREAMIDNLLLSYNFIFLDEAHERTVDTDVLFGIVKQAQDERRGTKLHPLNIILMSATMDVDHFSNFFDKAPVVYLEGRQFSVDVYHAKSSQDDYVQSCLVTVFQIHRETPPNEDILVFLTGQEEIEAMVYSIRTIAKELEDFPPLKVYPLYSSLSTQQQLDIFYPTPKGSRKVVVSTNIAETSVTIPRITYVIDSGMVKARTHYPGTGLDILKVQRVSQAQAWQRTGRAGRESEGHCYRMFTSEEFDNMLPNTIPEIQRCNLCSVVLKLLELNINAVQFDFIDKPPVEAIFSALEQLHLLGAIDSVKEPNLTSIGHKLAKFPLDPHFSKIILESDKYNCNDEILSIVALLSGESVFVTPIAKKEQANAAKQKFISPEGDHITLLNVYSEFEKAKFSKQWCFENFLNGRNLLYASEVRIQLQNICRSLEINPSSCGPDTDNIRKSILSGLFTNVAVLQRDRSYHAIDNQQKVSIHPSSALFGSLPNCVVFTEIVKTGRSYMRHLSLIDSDWLSEIVPEYARKHDIS